MSLLSLFFRRRAKKQSQAYQSQDSIKAQSNNANLAQNKTRTQETNGGGA